MRGYTLFELLIALALLALLALMASSSVRASSPRLAVKLTSEQLLADVKRARLESGATNRPITIAFSEHSYSIPELNIERTLQSGVHTKLTGGDGKKIVLGPGFWLSDYRITVTKGVAFSTVSIDAVTRRATLE